MVEKNSALHRQQDGKELDSSNAKSSASDKDNLDRSIHSIEEGGEHEEETAAADYSFLQAIPPFNKGHAVVVQRPTPIRDNGIISDSMDDSSHSASSLGSQSNFIQQRINKHKKKGDWYTAVEDSISSSSDDDGDSFHDDGVKKTDTVDTSVMKNNNECPGNNSINKQPPVKATVPRTPSLVSLLKMEPICEKKVRRNDLNYNEDDDNDGDDDDDGTDMSGISDDARYDIGDIMDTTTPDQPIDGEETTSRQSKRSFLPNITTEQQQQQQQQQQQRFVEVEITPMVDVISKSGDDSDTFGFTSIHSTDNITHASDAPDYDYNSEQHYGEPNNHNSTNNEEEDSRIIQPPPANRAMPYHRQKFIPPMERRRRSSLLQEQGALRTERDEVCQVLGLPKDKPRKVQRGIMSRNTELRLRTFLGDESDNHSFDQVESATPKLASNNNKGINSSSVGSGDSASSGGDSSMDLAFGDSREIASKEDDKWERTRRERRVSRQSMTSSSATAITTTTNATTTSSAHANATSGRNTTEESIIWHNSFNWIKKPLYNVDDDDDDDETKSIGHASVKTKASLIGKIYSHFQRPKNEADNHESSSSDSDSSDDSSSDDSSDDEDDTWDMNVLTEGEYYLSMSMLVYVYGLLRQTSLLGHTEISFDEVDVNSSQSESRMDKSHRYLNKTKSAGFIIRVVMDELEKKGAFSSVEKEGDVR